MKFFRTINPHFFVQNMTITPLVQNNIKRLETIKSIKVLSDCFK